MRRKYSRASALAGLLGLIISVSVGVDVAAAHSPGDDQADVEHAKQDLAGTSIEQIEKQTLANAAKIKKATGDTPGRPTAEQNVPNASISAAAAADPGQGGAWSSVVNTDQGGKTGVVPIFQAVLPNGKVLMWDSVGQNAPESMTNNTFTRAQIWDPNANPATTVRKDVPNYNIFCAGYTQLANGNVLLVGGNKNAALDGIVQTHIFDWRKEEQGQMPWSRGPDMAAARWYPAVQALGNNEAVIVGGGPTVPEVYQTNNTLRRLTNASGYSDRLYAFLSTRPDGQVQLMGPPGQMSTINTSGTGAISATQTRDNINRTYGGFATYNVGRSSTGEDYAKALVVGGGDITEGGQNDVPTKTAKVVSVNGSTTAVSSTASMSVGRRQHNLTILADGSVLATGGMSRATNANVDLNNPVFAAERWDPATGTWTVLSGASRVRQYHSSATLLPDGRVLTGGGGVCASCVSAGYLEKNIEYFEPPYLYKKDGSGQKATRPVISSAPSTATYGQGFNITSTQAGSIAKVGLVRLGAATHSQDQGQRYVPLSFTVSGSTITATPPATSNIAPAGYYMLFITDTAGVPSVAKMIQVQQKPAVKGAPSDFNGDGFSDAVVADPYADPGGAADAGQLTVRYGNSSTIGGGSVDTLVQGSGSVGNTASAGDRFGSTLAAADLDNDGYTDLLVGTPYEDISGQADSGLAQVIWGSSGGLGEGRASTQLTQSSFGRTAAAGDQLGYALDASNELGADLPMAAVGVPRGNVSGQNDAGWVGLLAAGLNDPRAVDQNSAGIPGAAEAGDRFGEAITLGLMAGTSSRVDAAVGTPGEDLGSGTSAITNGGAFTIINDLYTGVVAGQAYDQNSSGVPGTPEGNDAFGQVVDSVRAGGTTHLAVGIPSEDIGTAADAGSVQLFSSTGTTITPGVGLTQDITNVADTSEAGDQFGRRLVLAPPGLSDTKTRLAVSAPYEDLSAVADAGLVQIFPLDDLGAEVTYDQNKEIDSTPIEGSVAANDHFGEGLGFVAGVAERSILIGVPDDVEFSSGIVHVIPLPGGPPRTWRPGVGGVPPTAADRFGGAAGGEVQQ
ncbi:MAG TPA: galactose oxidase-like domain-containing protein [Propionibacteriaceae bacterium]